MNRLGLRRLLTFGGAFSNHIAAVAAAGKHFGFETIGLIRGEKVSPLNPTLQFATDCGMALHFLDRTTYREKEDPAHLKTWQDTFGPCYILPEGGSNSFALPGCAEMVQEVLSQLPEAPHFLGVSCGTGATLAGLLTALPPTTQALGFSALKGDFHEKEVVQLLHRAHLPIPANWKVVLEYHFGGYAKFQPPLIHFMNQFKSETGISLDPVYTGKMMFGIFDLIQKDYFPPGATLLAIHTGGLQGIAGFHQAKGKLLDYEG